MSAISNYQFFLGMIIISMITIASLAAPLVTSKNPYAQENPSLTRYQSPSTANLFGTDKFGRDVFARVLYGGRVSLLIALGVVLISVVFGSIIGAVSGYAGGFWDTLTMRFLDALLSFPIIFLTITCAALFGSGLLVLILILAFTSWMDIARLVRTEVLSLKNQPFILKAKAAGLSVPRIILTHLIPNTFATLLSVAVLRIADIILIESALSFIGLGVQPPAASWGAIISEGRSVLASAWWLSFFPGLAIAMTTIGLNMIGDGLRIQGR